MAKRDPTIVEGKAGLEEKYRSYLKEKPKFKEFVKELRVYEINKSLEGLGEADSERLRCEVEKRYIEAMPEFERLRAGVFDELLGFVNKNADFLMEKHYFDRNFFRREKVATSLERIERFEL